MPHKAFGNDSCPKPAELVVLISHNESCANYGDRIEQLVSLPIVQVDRHSRDGRQEVANDSAGVSKLKAICCDLLRETFVDVGALTKTTAFGFAYESGLQHLPLDCALPTTLREHLTKV